MHLLLSLLLLLASPLRFVSFTAEDGLSSNSVLAIRQDSEGFMWFGTENGLTRFDGVHALVFKEESIPGKMVRALAEDASGNLWIGTSKGLCVRAGGTFKAKIFTAHGNEVRALCAGAGGSVLAAYRDGYLEELAFKDGQISVISTSRYDIPEVIEGDYRYQQLFPDRQGRLWIGGRKIEAQMLSEGKLRNLARISGNYAQLPDGSIYGYDDFHPMLTRWNGEAFEDIFDIPVRHARLLCDSKGRLWAAGFYGLALIDLAKGESQHFLKDEEFNCIYEDASGGIWLGGENGAKLLSPVMNRVLSFDEGRDITALMQDSDSLLWIGTPDRGAEILDLRSGRRGRVDYRIKGAGSSEGRVSCLYQDSAGKIYIGLWARCGFNLYDKKTGRCTRHALPPELFGSDWYADFLEDRSGRLWAATWEGIGLNEFDRSSGRFTGKAVEGLCTRLASCLFEDSRGTLWYGTTEEGLDAIDSSGKVTHHLDGEYIVCLGEDAAGRVLAGTRTGLYAMPGGPVKGLEMQIASIEKDRSGRVWVSTEEGLYLLGEDGPSKVGKYLGFNSDVYGPKVSCTMLDCSLAFGGKNGFNVFNPDSLIALAGQPAGMLVSWTRGGKARSRERDIAVDFASRDLAAGRYLRYRYMLEGEESEWNYASAPKLSAKYSNLPPGRYRLRIQSEDILGRWSGDAYSKGIRVLPPLLLTWPFILLYIALLVGSVAALIKFRERMLQHEKAVLEETVALRTRELQQEVESKNNFFSIVAHDLKNPVIGMKNLSALLEKNFDGLDRASLKEAVAQISKTSERTSDMLEQLLLWALGQKDMIRPEIKSWSLSDLVSEAVGGVAEQAAEKRLKIGVGGCDFSVLTDRNLFITVLRNLLTNAVKFSPEGAAIEVSSDGKRLSVRDHGVGMPPETVEKLFRIDTKRSTSGTAGEKGTGLGLIIVKELLDKLGSTVDVESTPGEGSSFNISLNKE